MLLTQNQSAQKSFARPGRLKMLIFITDFEDYNNVKEYLAKTRKLPDTKLIETFKTAIQDPVTVPDIFSSVVSLVEPMRAFMYVRQYKFYILHIQTGIN